MGKIVVIAFVTLDGVIQAPGLPDEDRDGGFEFGGWTQRYADPEADRRITESVLRADALLLGRRTYQLFSGFWPGADPADPKTARLNAQPKYVVSQTLHTAEWNNSTLLGADAFEEIAKLKQRYDEISIWGSSRLIPALLGKDLIDEFVLYTYPLVLGSGKKLFGGDRPVDLELAYAEPSASGVIMSGYRVAG